MHFHGVVPIEIDIGILIDSLIEVVHLETQHFVHIEVKINSIQNQSIASDGIRIMPTMYGMVPY